RRQPRPAIVSDNVALGIGLLRIVVAAMAPRSRRPAIRTGQAALADRARLAGRSGWSLQADRASLAGRSRRTVHAIAQMRRRRSHLQIDDRAVFVEPVAHPRQLGGKLA